MNFRVFVFVLLGFSVGCGPSQSSPNVPAVPVTSTPSPVTGNWEFDLEPTAVSAASLPLYKLTGYLSAQSSGSAIHGQLQGASTAATSACVLANNGVAATGTIDSSSNVTLSGPLGGSTLSIFGNYNAALGEIFGNITLAGGSCNVASTAIQGDKIADLTGTWIGILQNTSNPVAPTSSATATFSQAASPNADGSFTLTGSVSLSGACTGTYPFQAGTISGATFSSEGSGTPAAAQYIAGSAPRFGFTVIPSATVMLTGCASGYSGALAKQ